MMDTSAFIFEQIASGKFERNAGVELLTRLKQAKSTDVNEIAVIGMAVKLPMAPTLEQLWHNLKYGIDSIGRFPAYRRADTDRYLAYMNQLRPDTDYSLGAYLEEIDKFDYKFFRLTPKEASLMSPAQRLFLEAAWETIEEAGYGGNKLSGSRTGVYIGYSSDTLFEYVRFIQDVEPSSLSMSVSGNLSPIVASRISHMLDLRGPSLAIDTTCSSSLVALHTACQSIRNGECEQALVGGIRINYMRLLNQFDIGIQSSDGKTKSFDDFSDGTGSGEGIIAVLLKPLHKAVRDGDQIHAVIKGSAINQDGNSIGLTAPNGLAQEEVIVRAWKAAGVEPETISYIEAHGTGTKLGDPIEIEAIQNAFRRYTPNRQFCGVGSIKTNFGHLDNASGLLGLVKTILALKHREIPASLHFQKSNREIRFEDSPVYFIDRLTPWRTNGQPRRAGVSSFGLSGTNCHVVLEEAQTPEPTGTDKPGGYLLPLSAKSEEALRNTVERYLACLQNNPCLNLADVCYTAGTGRGHYAFRLAIHAHDVSELQTKLGKLLKEWPSVDYPSEGIFCGANEMGRQPEEGWPVTAAVEKLYSLSEQDGNSRAQLLAELGYWYVRSADIPWEALYSGERRRKVSLPSYPFARSRCWISITPQQNPIKEQTTVMNVAIGGGASLHQRKFLNFLKQALQEISGIPEEEIRDEDNFFELGLDSILLFQISEKLKDHYGIEISLSRFYDELSTPGALAEYLAALVPEESSLPTAALPATQETPVQTAASAFNHENLPMHEHATVTRPGSRSEMERLVARQLDIMSKQLELLREDRNAVLGMPVSSSVPSNQPEADSAKRAEAMARTSSVSEARLSSDDGSLASRTQEPEVFIPYQKLNLLANTNLSNKQTLHIEELICRLDERFKLTKKLTQKYRNVLANNRNVAGFRPAWKEMIFPVIAKRAQGARIWDMDEHEYLDISMGFGAYLLGHAPAFITDAVRVELDNGMPIGPMNPLAGEVADQIAQFTGCERVAFFNSGSEAVMVALRLARAVTGKSKIALFEGAFHGTFDGVLARRHMAGRDGNSVPMAPGITDNLVGDVLVLKYGDPEALDVISRHANELAAVLVEPVQSRRPDLQPRRFLQELRAITEKHGTALIFDEVITGFRIGPGGAQEWFDVQADIATYGKVIGAGLPVGIVAGKSRFLNAIDGGWWQYGDASYPTSSSNRTLVGGTFCHHPLTMSSILAMLKHLRAEGPRLQERLNERTRRLTDTLNQYFLERRIPISMVHFGSLFRFVLNGDLELLFYHLLDKGIYVWEGRNCFLSTAHTDEDVDLIIRAVIESVEDMQAGGFFPEMPATPAEVKSKRDPKVDLHREAIVPMTESQQNLWLLTRDSEEQSIAHCDYLMLELHGTLNLGAMQVSMQRIVERHEILRTIQVDERGMLPESTLPMEIPLIDFTNDEEEEQNRRIEEWLRIEAERPFAIGLEPLFRMYMLKVSDVRHRFVIVLHHLIADGWSTGVMLNELETFYTAECRGEIGELPPAVPFRNYVEWLSNKMEEGDEAIRYWSEKFARSIPSLALPNDYPPPPGKSYAGAREHLRVDEVFTKRLKSLSRKQGCSLFVTLLGAYQLFLHRLTGQNEFSVGIPTAGQSDMGVSHLVGQCASMLTLEVRISPEGTFAEHLKEVKQNFSDGMKHRHYMMVDLVKEMSKRQQQPASEIQATFNLDRSVNLPRFADLETAFTVYPIRYVKHDLSLNAVETGGELQFDFDYNADLFSRDTVRRWMRQFRSLLETVVEEPDVVHMLVTLAAPDEGTIFPTALGGYPEAAEASDSDLAEQYAHALAQAFELTSGQEVIIDSQLPNVDRYALSLAGKLSGAQVRITENVLLELDSKAALLFLSAAAWREIIRETHERDSEAGATIRVSCAVIGDQPILAEQVRRYCRKSGGLMPLRFGFRPAGLPAVLTVFDANEQEERRPLSALPIGLPLANTVMLPLEASGRPAPVGVYAELYAAAPWLNGEGGAGAAGGRPDGLIATGRIGRYLSTGMLEQIGTLKEQLTVRGHRVDPAYVKTVFSLLPQVEEVVIAKADSKGRDPVMAAYLTLGAGVKESVDGLRRSLKELLPDFMIPARIRVTERLPLTPAGTMNLQALAELERTVSQQESTAGSLQDDMERKLKTIWGDLLGIEEVDPGDNFFELGGQSFHAMLLMFKIQEEWGVELPLTDIFEAHSLYELSQRIGEAKRGDKPSIPKAERKAYYPVSSAQKRQYVLQQTDPSSTAYHLNSSFLLEGRIDREALEEAFQKLIHRHEALRTSFALVEGEVVQIVHENVDLPLLADDSTILADRFVQPFDLGHAPLLRVRLRKESEEKHLIELEMHHIVSDGISMNVLFRDVAAFYQGQGNALPTLEYQYKDYSEWQLKQLDSEQMRRHELYWIEQFAEEPPKLQLPTDYARSSVKSFEGGSLFFSFDENLLHDLNLLARRSGVTLYMVLLAVYQLLLSKYSGQQDIVVGSPTAGRPGLETENVIGMFVNTLALRARPTSDLTFLEFLRQVKASTLAALEHQAYPLDRLIDKLALERDTSRNPLFDVLFVFDNNMNESLIAAKIDGIRLVPLRRESQTAQFDLALHAVEEGRTLRFTLEYAGKLFAKETAERLTRHFEQLVKQAVLHPGLKLDEFEMTTVEEREQIEATFNRTEAEYDRNLTLHRLFEEQAARTPERMAAVFGPDGMERLTYRELNKRANQLARTLRDKGVKP
ncbi:aminotransferase class III-fold pyridoxal phosphate-dependent enzyme, partial [Paenibacillus sp. NAIST15-1]|uniref:aminotransferase class III-fold pyridoxal phosphate-dependent enzyme n=1 Tax=Paenibacillus sp. NAIST15-1 TaxID=1605994 RepID=UPI0011151098